MCICHNYVYFKLFRTFDLCIIRDTQYYCGSLPFSFLLDLRTINFYIDLLYDEVSPAGILFRTFGTPELDVLLLKYDMTLRLSPVARRRAVWEVFRESCAI